MADSVSRKANRRRLKNPKLDKGGEKSKSSTNYGRLREADRESDEYARQYALFHYDFYRTEGFGIEWEKFDFFLPHCLPYDGAPPLESHQTNEEVIKEETLRAIAYYNQNNGANIMFLQHIEANFSLSSFYQNWITFWAVDTSSPCHEPKIYQAHTKQRGRTYELVIFRVKPTEEEMEAAPIHVDPPPPYSFGRSKPLLVFDWAGPRDDPVPGTPFIFNRVPHPPLPPPLPSKYLMCPPPPRPVEWMDGSSSMEK